MLFSPDRDQLRAYYYQCWEKANNKQILEPQEAEVVRIIESHPEYHYIFTDQEKFQNKDFNSEHEINPFLHMAFHAAIREQISTDRPGGIKKIHVALLQKMGDPHVVEHEMMTELTEMIWQVVQNQAEPDEAKYLANLQKLLR